MEKHYALVVFDSLGYKYQGEFWAVQDNAAEAALDMGTRILKHFGDYKPLSDYIYWEMKPV